jgi:hypothetical protein
MAAAANQAQRQVVAYQPVEYVSPSTGQRHKIQPTKAYTNPVTKETCMSYDNLDYGDGSISAAKPNGNVCTGADGKLH